jgi:inosine-uridine nucleoside N-ribohydrolase
MLRLLLVLVALAAPFATPSAATESALPSATRRPIPVVLATDIGSDIDDTWALAHLLRSPELDLRMVLTETGDARYRAAVTAKLLESAERTDIPIALGRDFGPMEDKDRHQAPWIRGYDLGKYPGQIHLDGIAAFVDLVMREPEGIIVIAIGPVPSLAAALEREPRLASRCRLIGMFGSFDVGYDGAPSPSAEYNVAQFPAALRTVLAAPWRDVLLTPLDTCGLVALRGDAYRQIWSATGDPLLRAVIENYCIFAPRVPWMVCDFFTTRSTVLFDCVAIYLAYAEDLTDVLSVRFRISEEGFTVRDTTGPHTARVALRWKDLPAFESHLTQRLLSGK